MTKRWFKLVIPDEVWRKMNREEYYQVRSWLRKCEWIMANNMGKVQ